MTWPCSLQASDRSASDQKDCAAPLAGAPTQGSTAMDRNGRALPLLDDETRAVKSARFSTQRWITKAMLLENAAPLVQRRASTCSETSFARELLEQRRSSFRLSGVRWALPTGGLSLVLAGPRKDGRGHGHLEIQHQKSNLSDYEKRGAVMTAGSWGMGTG